MSIGIIGYGFVGKAIYESFKLKNINVYVYDKNQKKDSFESCLNSEMLFLCLPTPYIQSGFDINAIIETCDLLKQNNYNGIVIIKSTVEVGTIEKLEEKYKETNFFLFIILNFYRLGLHLMIFIIKLI